MGAAYARQGLNWGWRSMMFMGGGNQEQVMNELSSVFREDDPMGIRDGFSLPEFPTADDAAKAAEKLGIGAAEKVEIGLSGFFDKDDALDELFDTNPKEADITNPTLAPTRPPVPEAGESMGPVFESNHGYFAAKPGTTPLDPSIEKVIF